MLTPSGGCQSYCKPLVNGVWALVVHELNMQKYNNYYIKVTEIEKWIPHTGKGWESLR